MERGHTSSTSPTRKRRTVFDLPVEICDQIFAYLLVDNKPIVARYGPATRYAQHARHDLPPQTVTQLTFMSWANRELRKEARSYFFSQNRFQATGSECLSHSNFLIDIGAEGRANIAKLDLDGDHFWRYNSSFFDNLQACKRLRDLTIRMHVGHLISGECYDSIRNYILDKEHSWVVSGCSVNFCIPLLKMFTLLPALQHLNIKCDIPTWAPSWVFRV
ncbi:hypothetical protein CC86DRAFT_464815 [Ophiobolus disseminans]|uniref:F-box domain-containing protein n=1 Tax=Ophiobolus disseminans TaxID=1469910 RepID=A0A6A7A8W6_9PLEO|nr:hypothetical protein CC86DRAFT_464815 [Ophiobolus disseminans]